MLRAATLAAALLLAVPAFADDAAPKPDVVVYGDAINVAGEPIPVEKLLADPAAFAGKTVLLKGTIQSVCQTRGCWVKLSPAGANPTSLTPGMDSAFVKLICDTPGQLVPTDSGGATALVRGEVVIEEIDEATARHYAEDAGATKEQIEQIVGSQKTVRVMSPGVAVIKEAAAEKMQD